MINEKAMLENKSLLTGVTKSAYIKMYLKNSEIKAAPSVECKELLKQLNYIGHNINQITKAINIGIALPEDIKEIKFKLNAIYKLIRENL